MALLLRPKAPASGPPPTGARRHPAKSLWAYTMGGRAPDARAHVTGPTSGAGTALPTRRAGTITPGFKPNTLVNREPNLVARPSCSPEVKPPLVSGQRRRQIELASCCGCRCPPHPRSGQAAWWRPMRRQYQLGEPLVVVGAPNSYWRPAGAPKASATLHTSRAGCRPTRHPECLVRSVSTFSRLASGRSAIAPSRQARHETQWLVNEAHCAR